MEISVVLAEQSAQPGQLIHGVVTIRLANNPYKDREYAERVQRDPETEAIRLVLDHLDHSKGQSSLSSSAWHSPSNIFDLIQLQLIGKCILDPHKLNPTIIQPNIDTSPHTTVIFNSSIVDINDFKPSASSTNLHQPYACQSHRKEQVKGYRSRSPIATIYAFDGTLPASLAPSFKGQALRIVYYLAVSVSHQGHSVCDLKVPFRIRVSQRYYRAWKQKQSQQDAPFITTTPIIPMIPNGLKAELRYHRIHQPQSSSIQPTIRTPMQSADDGHAVAAVSTSQIPSHDDDDDNDIGPALPQPPRSMLFKPQTIERVYESPNQSNGPSYSRHRPHTLSLSSISTKLLSDPISPITPTTPPTPDYIAEQRIEREYQQQQLKHQVIEDPSYDAMTEMMADRAMLQSLPSLFRQSLSFHINEQIIVADGQEKSLAVVKVILERGGYRAGDIVRGWLDFSATQLPCYRVVIQLCWNELIHNPKLLSSASSSSSSSSAAHFNRVHASYHQYTMHGQILPFIFQIPPDATTNFSTRLISVYWSLNFKFIVATPPKPTMNPMSNTTNTRSWSAMIWGDATSSTTNTTDNQPSSIETSNIYDNDSNNMILPPPLHPTSSHHLTSSQLAITYVLPPNTSMQRVTCLPWSLPLNVLPLFDSIKNQQPAIRTICLPIYSKA